MRPDAWIRRSRRWLADRLDTSGEPTPAYEPNAAAGARRAHRAFRDAPPAGPAHPWQRGGVPWNLRAVSEWAARFLVIGLAVLLALYILVRLRLVVFPVIVALFLSALLRPGVNRLQASGFSRGAAAATVFVGGLAVVTGIGIVVGRILADGVGELADNVEQAIEDTKRWLAGAPFRISESELENITDSIGDTLSQNQDALVSGGVGAAVVVAELLTGAILVLFTTFFFLYDGERIWRWFVSLFPHDAIPHVAEAGRRAWRTLAGYVHGTIIVAFVDGFFIGIVLLVLGVPLAIPLAVLVFFGAFVPLVGATITGALAVLVALVTKGFVTALLVLAGIIAVQQLEGHVLQPFVLGRFVRVHPLAVILAITAGAVLAGIGGAVIAVPVVAVTNTVGRYFVELARERRAAEAMAHARDQAGVAADPAGDDRESVPADG